MMHLIAVGEFLVSIFESYLCYFICYVISYNRIVVGNDNRLFESRLLYCETSVILRKYWRYIKNIII
ncbi:hypothetical protein Q648_00810 [Bartonella quintana JK 12]|uniref:Uncharacterized protein n=2 Tax=Bartonella quintana TaxID=803 RepID=W3U083_BARQI|nr:hypothetical protein Q651_01306 [Bartonella quintana BQ2-D70]ETS14582.1 hypothetical protein Q650_01223 [Bartonella quintana JK 73rel]ETS16269.1 hypothetical protein Q649_01232 [Bartonella quintana JK 73]ETS18272.1 hypothetical protein Q647_01221 [Bartonella quintana JK 7]ETS19101.1 hypothetical protein Q648_00810 [Bartonella quintana JK 12]KEC60298.1 hypothetical protein O93_00046 [Bartonella quintana JK 19]KEC60836.1 hypothetical protein O91_01018 [Bartonella quintana JK 31]KEC61445.1 h